ncbi:conserved hypothetical protein (plasmid) [Novosphingobium sp. PP1Y]|nr:conserved hypothetical protein [Novosphingobium sp. PP1Y]
MSQCQFPSLLTRPLFTMTVAVENMHEPGGPGGAGLRVANISGGSFTGDRLSGIILSGGIDWLTARGDGVTLLDARFVIQTDDGALIAMAFTGKRHGPADVMAALARGEKVDPAMYYLRIAPSFTTESRPYTWLNGVLAVGTGDRRPEGPVYQIHEIL